MMFFLQINIFFCLNEETLTLNLDIFKNAFYKLFRPGPKEGQTSPSSNFRQIRSAYRETN